MTVIKSTSDIPFAVLLLLAFGLLLGFTAEFLGLEALAYGG